MPPARGIAGIFTYHSDIAVGVPTSDAPIGAGEASGIVEQIVRPTGLVDPKITIRPARGQVDDLIPRIEGRIEKKERVLVTTLTKKMAEDLSGYLHDVKKIKVNYLHSDVKTLDRIRILPIFGRESSTCWWA